MVEDLAYKLRERSELTQDKWHSKDGYEEDIHSGYCTIAVKVKKEITAVSHQTYPASGPPPKQGGIWSNSSLKGLNSPPTHSLTRSSVTTGLVLSQTCPD